MSPSCLPGMGLRTDHYPYLETRPKTSVKWFEAVSENYMDTEGRPMQILELIREDYPVALHGVSMSLASTEGLQEAYLKKLRALVDRIEPFIVSDHLCWTGQHSKNVHDLLPFPHTDESLSVIVDNINKAQDFLGWQLTIENVSTYLTFNSSEFEEWDFLKLVAKKTGAKILMDVNNVHVSAHNHGFSGADYIDQIPAELIDQIHLAGYTDAGDFLFDTHSKPVHEPVWPLFEQVLTKAPSTPFMMEWDEDVPEFHVVEEEVKKAIAIWDRLYGDTRSKKEATV